MNKYRVANKLNDNQRLQPNPIDEKRNIGNSPNNNENKLFPRNNNYLRKQNEPSRRPIEQNRRQVPGMQKKIVETPLKTLNIKNNNKNQQNKVINEEPQLKKDTVEAEQTSKKMSDSSEIKPFKGQVWEELRRKYNRNNLFEDPVFPANNKSLYFSQPPPKDIVWRRVTEVIENPQFVINGFGRCDLDQGYIGNCWFIAGCVGIMQSEKCFAKVVPLDQGFGDNYGGIFHFRFWLYGEWIDVVIDDRLAFWPDGQLVFCSNKEQQNELWGSLLEKAYAKVYGSYESLEGGCTTDALIDMSGGIDEVWSLNSMTPLQRKNFWNVLYQSYKRNSIIACSIEADRTVREAVQSNGLIKGHAYTVIDLIEFEFNGKNVRLLRVRNPWGDDREWRGAWSDKSREWKSVSDEIKKKVNFSMANDGEFWMSFDDFLSNWDEVQICHLSAESFSEEILKQDDDSDLCWNCTTYNGEWRAGNNAGGCGQPNMQKFWTNPQFMITLKDVDKNDNEDKATIIVALMQKDTRLKRMEQQSEDTEEYIQFRLYRVKDNVQVDQNKTSGVRFYANQLEDAGDSGTYLNRREVTQRFRVKPGNYVIIPSTFDADRNCKFLLRLFTESVIKIGELNSHKPSLNDNEIKLKLNKNSVTRTDYNKIIDNSEKQVEQAIAKPAVNDPKKPPAVNDPKQPLPNDSKKQPENNPKKPNNKPKPVENNEPEDACLIM